MIDFKSGDILSAEAEALVNTVNCVGIMGRGIALQFKKAFPDNFRDYEIACHDGEVKPGQMFVHETRGLTHPRLIINFPTKRHWKGKSRIEDIEAGLVDLVRVIKTYRIRSLAIPPLGSGLGGLNWGEVRPRIERAVQGLEDVHILVYEPNGSPDARSMTASREVPNMTLGRASLVILMVRYLQGLLDPFVTLLEVQKLMYFLQVAGQPLRLKFVQHHYGPYAENLRHVLHAIEGHLVSGYGDGGDAPEKQLELVPGAVPDAEEFLRDNVETTARLTKVADLVDGFETPFGLELLSTVHWVSSHGKCATSADVIGAVYNWNEKKRQFKPHQIVLALNILKEKGWVEAYEAKRLQ